MTTPPIELHGCLRFCEQTSRIVMASYLQRSSDAAIAIHSSSLRSFFLPSGPSHILPPCKEVRRNHLASLRLDSIRFASLMLDRPNPVRSYRSTPAPFQRTKQSERASERANPTPTPIHSSIRHPRQSTSTGKPMRLIDSIHVDWNPIQSNPIRPNRNDGPASRCVA